MLHNHFNYILKTIKLETTQVHGNISHTKGVVRQLFHYMEWYV